ncbi:MAG: tRNA (adenosine(37)-N6)-threonylcarbamoyltransferase complex dimerization subunit type 1 TsaB [Victivallales bacterium]|nr:tRNA (adenosine(37)-N6)-threonylcarbamoyltransferase complex dimerization subunit type 1 TsaB [Victivallales bacterium]
MFSAALDSSLKCTLVIANDNTILFNESLDSASRDNDRKLPPWILQAVSTCGLTLQDIRRWTVGTGPGSFAGLRSGIAHIMGIATATGAAIRGVPSAIATASAAHPAENQRVGVIMDGRCGEVILVTVKDSRLDAPPRAMLPEGLMEEGNVCDIWITPQSSLLPPLPQAISETIHCIDSIDATALLKNTTFPWPSCSGDAIKSCEPLYVRPPVFTEPTKPLDLLALKLSH